MTVDEKIKKNITEPFTGCLFFNIGEGQLYMYDGYDWIKYDGRDEQKIEDPFVE